MRFAGVTRTVAPAAGVWASLLLVPSDPIFENAAKPALGGLSSTKSTAAALLGVRRVRRTGKVRPITLASIGWGAGRQWDPIEEILRTHRDGRCH